MPDPERRLILAGAVGVVFLTLFFAGMAWNFQDEMRAASVVRAEAQGLQEERASTREALAELAAAVRRLEGRIGPRLSLLPEPPCADAAPRPR